MSGPWEDFRAAEKPPWEDFRAAEKGPEEDRYRAAAREDIARQGSGTGRLQRQIMQGLTFGAADEIIAGALTPFEMIRRGTINPVEGYNYAKAREDMALEQDRSRDGLLGSVAEVGAGIATGVGAANAGLTAGRFLGANAGLGARSLAAAADGAAYGGLTGALTGSGEGRIGGAATGALTGGVVGGALPGVMQGVSTLAAPITSNISARMNPERFAQNQVARAVSESGRPVQQIVDDVATAAKEGQGVYTLADALGNPGQRMLSTVTRNPGAGRTQAVEFLDARQAEQGRRIAGSLDDAFGSSQTAKQLQGVQEAARRAEAASLYGEARNQAGAVDVSRAIAAADDVLQPGLQRVMSPQSGIADNSIDSAVRQARALLTDGRSNLSDFTQVMRAKREIDDMIGRATRSGSGGQVEQLTAIRNEIDKALTAASAPYARARDAYRSASEGIDAIQTGREAATRGRFEDTTGTFTGMGPVQQAGFRSGYGDVLTERVQNAAQGVNKARDFTSDAMRQELPAFSRPGQAPLLDRRIGRENTMFETRNAAMGGSKTAENLADSQATGLSPEIIGNVLSGNFSGALRNLTSRAGAGVTGNTAQVREKLAEILLARGGNAAQIGTILQQSQNNADARRRMVEVLLRGAMGGGSAAPGALSIPSTSGR